MRADIHDGREPKRSNQRPDTLMQDRIRQIDEIPCTTRPDHTLGSDSDLAVGARHVWFTPHKQTLASAVSTAAMCHFQTHALQQTARRAVSAARRERFADREIMEYSAVQVIRA